ncbi:HAUS augmin-like complex subunit 2 isoform X2 [Hemicordylus capensis]|uniref:HAUS augmin-like complex subunit 2 isoform X2 n=1 Tax=Hemicordylus capensis TaxID=884348 RepID=UPI0023040312|nr:HAUS augmin-like complex subunit 2 isoform X2 [Hemicordylus capensis]
MASSNPWDPVQPTVAGLMLSRCLSAGVVSREILDICCKPDPCFTHLSEAEQIGDLQAEINQIKMDIELLQLEKETADIAHPFYLTQKCQALQAMNRHLEAVLKEKRALRQRLMKPVCQESLPVEAVFQRYAAELLTMAVAFIEKLEAYLTTVRNIPQIPLTIKNMDSALAKMELLVMETEELAEQILQWREKQKAICFDNSQLTGGSDSCFKSIMPQ